MDQHQAFLQAVCEEPDEDLHRLVYADWLEDRGDAPSLARSEFIRLQIELGRLAPDDPRHETLKSRGQKLLREHETAWVAKDLRGLVAEGVFRRGFVEKVTLPAEDYQDHAAQLVGLAPLREVRLTGIRSCLRQLLSSPLVGGIQALDLSGNFLDDADVAQMIRTGFLNRLTGLDLGNNELHASTLTELARSSHLDQLTDLNLSLNGINGAGMTPLNGLPHLTSLNLNGNRICDQGLRALLLSATFIKHLTELRLDGNGITVNGIESLSDCARMGSLTVLDLSWNRLEEGVEILADCPHLSSLRELRLDFASVGEDGAAALLGSPYLYQLRRLSLRAATLSSATVEALRRRWGKGLIFEPSSHLLE
jgi:uncharacterized protein (TIGR02996 family)